MKHICERKVRIKKRNWGFQLEDNESHASNQAWTHLVCVSVLAVRGCLHWGFNKGK